jgi:predicted Zn-dependent protease
VPTPRPPAPPPELLVEPRACRDGAYLCPGLAERDEARVLRWADGTERITVLVPRPEVDDPGAARAIQDAAVAGIRAWQEKPFPLLVLRSGDPSEADFTVRWVRRLEGTQLGRTGTEWNRSADGRTGMRVQDMVLALEDPFAKGRLRAPQHIRLTAAHEMGHALGLPHSDSERDVMYPTNTARALTSRDYSAMTALYRLENGALIPPETLEEIGAR